MTPKLCQYEKSIKPAASDPYPNTQVIDAFGVGVETDLPVASTGFSPTTQKEAMIRILSRFNLTRHEQTLLDREQKANPDKESWTLNLDCDRVLYAWADGLKLLITDGGNLVEADSPSPQRLGEMTSFILNFAVSGALAIQGEETLHGTMLSLDGTGVGIVGPSGAGKSTLAACLISHGARLVTDDVMRLIFGHRSISVHHGADCLKLSPYAWQTFLPHAQSRGLFHPEGNKHLVRVPVSGVGPSSSTLHMLVYLDRQTEVPSGPSFHEVIGIEKFQLLAPSTMDVDTMVNGRIEQHFAFVKTVASQLPLYRLRCGRFPNAVAEMAQTILQVTSGRRR